MEGERVQFFSYGHPMTREKCSCCGDSYLRSVSNLNVTACPSCALGYRDGAKCPSWTELGLMEGRGERASGWSKRRVSDVKMCPYCGGGVYGRHPSGICYRCREAARLRKKYALDRRAERV